MGEQKVSTSAKSRITSFDGRSTRQHSEESESPLAQSNLTRSLNTSPRNTHDKYPTDFPNDANSIRSTNATEIQTTEQTTHADGENATREITFDEHSNNLDDVRSITISITNDCCWKCCNFGYASFRDMSSKFM